MRITSDPFLWLTHQRIILTTLESPPCLISRDSPNSCEKESLWASNTKCVMELSREKHPREDKDKDQVWPRKSRRVNPNKNILIDKLGRDGSINCLIRCSRAEYGVIAMLNRSFRSLVRSGELYKQRRNADIVEYWVYYSCSALEWDAFDPVRGRSMSLPRLTANEAFIFSDKESLAVGTELLVFGRDILSQVIYKYSILTNKWTSGMNMNVSRCLFASSSIKGIAILAGGCNSLGKTMNTAELYNSDNGTWEMLPSMNKARKMCSGVFMEGKFYVLGGIGEGDSKQLTCSEEYDLETRKWRLIPNMLPARNPTTSVIEAPPLVAVVNNILYAADYAEMVVRRYDKANNTWATIGGLPERVRSRNGWGLAFRACGDRLVVIGGSEDDGGRSVEVNSCVPGQGALRWDMLERRLLGSFVYNCTVMGC